MVDYLEADDVIQLHDFAIEDYGGLPGVDLNKLEGILAMPMAGFGDYEKYPNLIDKAAVYLYYLASGHAFKDGNKRTSYVATFTFLDWNGYDLIATDDEIEKFVLSIADHEKRPPFLMAVLWVNEHAHLQKVKYY